jgi:lactate dehydrogenase-like 2-hydroxyacid dehydrogenase
MENSRKIVVLDGDTLGKDVDLGFLSKFGDVKIYGRTLPEETAERISDAEIVLTNKVILDREILENAKSLKLIQITATGMNNVDLYSANEFGIAVKNVAGYSTESVVQHTFSVLFYLLGSLKYQDNFVREGAWTNSGIFTNVQNPFWEISGKTFGVIGFGTIGKRVAEVASIFGAKVIYYSTSGKNSSEKFEQVSLKELLEKSDVISIHAPLNDQTKSLLNKDNLHLIANGKVLLNMGRGGIVNEVDIADEVEKRNILFGTDVASTEPLPKENPLQRIMNRSNVFITPHIAWASIEARKKLLQIVERNISNFLS